MHMLFARFCLVHIVRSIVAVLYTFIGTGGYRCPISTSAIYAVVELCPFSNVATISHSTAEVTMFFNTLQRHRIVPFSIGSDFSEHLMK